MIGAALQIPQLVGKDRLSDGERYNIPLASDLSAALQICKLADR